MAIEIVSFPIKDGGSFHSFSSFTKGKYNLLLAVLLFSIVVHIVFSKFYHYHIPDAPWCWTIYQHLPQK